MKRFCESLKQRTIKIINIEKKKMIPSINKEIESYAGKKNFYISKKVSRKTRCR